MSALAALCPEAGAHWSALSYEQMLAQKGVYGFGVKDGPTLLGFALARLVPPPSPPLVPDEAEVLMLAVHPDWRRQGVAKRLMAALSGFAAQSGAIRMLLEVSAANAGANAFYHAQGWGEIGRRAGYYPSENGKAEDAVILSLEMGISGD